jgi:hypothetical protein
MKIEMKRAPRPRDPQLDTDVDKIPNVWWWQVIEEDGGQRVPDGAGWSFKRDGAYAEALKCLRATRAQRRAEQ